MKEFQTIEIKPPVPSETTTSYKTPKSKTQIFTIIDRDSNTLHYQAKEAIYIHIKDPSLKSETLQYSTNFSNITHN